MMEAWLNAIRAQAGMISGAAGQVRCGTVQSVDPSTYCAKVTLQPEGVLTGWLPIAATWVGAGWGLVAPPSPGPAGRCACAGRPCRAWHRPRWPLFARRPAATTRPPESSGWFIETGACLKLHNDGSIEGKATVWNLTGTIQPHRQSRRQR